MISRALCEILSNSAILSPFGIGTDTMPSMIYRKPNFRNHLSLVP